MKVGELYSSIELDGPPVQRGPIIRGRVLVRYGPAGSPHDVDELFGPLHISITVSGHLKTKIRTLTSDRWRTCRAHVPLFSRRQEVYRGAARIAVFETPAAYPFTFVLPATADDDTTESRMFKPGDPWDTTPGKPLPPSFDFEREGFNSQGEAHVEYGIQAYLTTPGIDVSIPPSRVYPFQYAPPPLPGPPLPDNPRAIRGSLSFKDRRRPSLSLSRGFLKDKASRLLSSVVSSSSPEQQATSPRTLALSWSITAPTHCHLGQPLVVQVRVEPQQQQQQQQHSNPELSSTPPPPPPPPAIKLISLIGAVRSHVSCRAQGNFVWDKLHEGEEGGGQRALTVEIVKMRGENDDNESSSSSYFQEQEEEEGDNGCGRSWSWTRTVKLSRELTGKLPGTEFRTCVICRRYELRIQATLEVDNGDGDGSVVVEERRINRRADLVVSPPLLSSGDGDDDDEQHQQLTTLEIQSEPAVGGSMALPPYEPAVGMGMGMGGGYDYDDGTLPPPPNFAAVIGGGG